MSKYDLAG